MTYKDVVDSVAQAVKEHRILRDFGYGAITDIKTVATDSTSPHTVDYPYIYLNPTQGSRNGQTITYRWNLISMDVVQEDPNNTYYNYLKVQSECQQYIDDILAYLRFQSPLKKFDLTLNVQLTPFKERFQDSVAGMTATLEIEIPQALNNCITPYFTEADLVLDVLSTQEQTFTPDTQQSPQHYPNTRIDTLNGMRQDDPFNFYRILTPNTNTLTFRETGTAVKVSGAGVPFINPRVITVLYTNGRPQDIIQPTFSTFPTEAEIGVPFEYECQWNGLQLDPSIINFIVVNDFDDPGVSEPGYTTSINTRLIGSYQPI